MRHKKEEVNLSKTNLINLDFLGYDLPFPTKYHKINCFISDCQCKAIAKVYNIKYLSIILHEK